MSLPPPLAQEWFVRDALAELDAVCPACRARVVSVLNHLAPDPAAAFAEIYRLSRAIRVQRFMAEKIEAGRRTDDWESLRLLLSINAGIRLSMAVHEAQREVAAFARLADDTSATIARLQARAEQQDA